MTISQVEFTAGDVYLNIVKGDEVETLTTTAEKAKSDWGTCRVTDFHEDDKRAEVTAVSE